MTARSTVDPSPPWTTLFPPVRSRASSRTSQTKSVGKRPTNGSRSSSQANQKSTTSLAPQGSIISTTTATYSGGTTLRRYTTLPSQQPNPSPPILNLSLSFSTPPPIPIETNCLPPGHGHDNIHGPCPHGCNNRSDTPITSVSLPVSQPVSNPSAEPAHVTIEPIFPSDPLDIYPTNTSSGSRRSSTLSKEWRHDPKRNEKAQKAASRIIEGCYSRKKKGKMWRMRDRVRRWGREFRKRYNKGERLKKRYAGGGGGGEGAGPKEEEARWSWRSGWKGRRGADKPAAAAAAAAASTSDLKETRWPGFALDSGNDGILSPPPPVPKPPRNSVVMERLAEVLGASSTETSFGFRRRDYLRQAEEKDTLPKNRRYADAYQMGVHEKHEKMQEKVKEDRTSGRWKQGLEKFKKLKLLVSPERRTTYSASRPATPRIAIKTKIVNTGLLHPHWKGRHLGSGGHSSSESRPGTSLASSNTRSKGQPASQTRPATMEVPESTTTTTTMDPNGEPYDEEFMVAPPTYWLVDSIHNASNGGNGKVPSRVSGTGKGKEIDYKLYHEDSVFKTQTPGFAPPRQCYKERCDCKGCNPIQVAMSPSDGDYKHPHCEGNGRHENQTSLPSSAGNFPSFGRPEMPSQLSSHPVDANDFTPGYSAQSLANVGTANASMLIGSMRSKENAAQVPSSPLNLDDYSSMDIDTREPPMHLPSRLPAYEFAQDEWPDTYALPPVVPTIAFSQIQEFTPYTIPTYTGANLPGTFEESAGRSGPTQPSYRTGGSLEEQDNDIMFVKIRNENKQPDNFVEGEDGRDTIKGEKAYHSTKKGHEVSEKSIEQASKPTSRSQPPTKTPSWISTNTHPEPHPKPNQKCQETPRSQVLLSKNNPYPPQDRWRIPESEEDQGLTTTTTRGPAQHIYDHYQDRDSHENEHKNEHKQHDETHDNSGRAPSYVGTGQRPPKLFFTRPRPRALAALASASSVPAPIFAALPSPVPEEDSITADVNADVDQQHDSDFQQMHDSQLEKKHRHSHHSHHTNRYSKSSSTSNNRRSSRSSWTLSISTISTRASSPHSHSSRSHKTSKRNSKEDSDSYRKNSSNKKRHSTGSINDVPHAGPSTWYKTTSIPQNKTTNTNRKRSSTASTTGTTATGSSRVSSLDKVTSNESSSSLKTHVHTYTRSHSHSHSHSHSRTRSGQTTGTVDTVGTIASQDSQDTSAHDTENSHDSHDTEPSDSNGLRHTRTASVQVDSDLLIIPLEEVEDYVLPPESTGTECSEGNGGGDKKDDAINGDEDVHRERRREGKERNRERVADEEYHRGSWEWERSPRERAGTGTGYFRGDNGGGGWRIVNGADGNHVRVRVKEVGGEGAGLSESVTTSTSGTGLWMKDSRGTIGTVGTEGTERLEVGSYGSYESYGRVD